MLCRYQCIHYYFMCNNVMHCIIVSLYIVYAKISLFCIQLFIFSLSLPPSFSLSFTLSLSLFHPLPLSLSPSPSLSFTLSLSLFHPLPPSPILPFLPPSLPPSLSFPSLPPSLPPSLFLPPSLPPSPLPLSRMFSFRLVSMLYQLKEC